MRDTGDGDKVLLQQAQTDALVAALPRQARIEIIDGKGKAWPISDRGAAAVLLKMDEAQGRLGTPVRWCGVATSPKQACLRRCRCQ